MVTKVTARGRITSAKPVQTNQVFSQAHLRVYFIGTVKLAFVTPATIRVAIPVDVALIDRLSFRCLEELQLRTIDFGVTNPSVSLRDIPARESYHIL
jgi:hypothetical protein